MASIKTQVNDNTHMREEQQEAQWGMSKWKGKNTVRKENRKVATKLATEGFLGSCQELGFNCKSGRSHQKTFKHASPLCFCSEN